MALALALFLFLADVCVRRVAIDWDKLWARAVSVVTPGKGGPRTMDRLRQRKEAVREARSETLAKFQAEPGVDYGPLEVADGSAEPAAGSPSQSRPAPKPEAAPGPGEDGYTNRLLAAKRRARKGIQDGQPADEDTSGDA